MSDHRSKPMFDLQVLTRKCACESNYKRLFSDYVNKEAVLYCTHPFLVHYVVHAKLKLPLRTIIFIRSVYQSRDIYIINAIMIVI